MGQPQNQGNATNWRRGINSASVSAARRCPLAAAILRRANAKTARSLLIPIRCATAQSILQQSGLERVRALQEAGTTCTATRPRIALGHPNNLAAPAMAREQRTRAFLAEQ